MQKTKAWHPTSESSCKQQKSSSSCLRLWPPAYSTRPFRWLPALFGRAGSFPPSPRVLLYRKEVLKVLQSPLRARQRGKACSNTLCKRRWPWWITTWTSAARVLMFRVSKIHDTCYAQLIKRFNFQDSNNCLDLSHTCANFPLENQIKCFENILDLVTLVYNGPPKNPHPTPVPA